MMDLSLFAERRFSFGILSGVGSYLVMFGVLLLVPFYVERGLGDGVARAGAELMALPLLFGLVAPLAGKLADRLGARSLTVSGMALVSGGLTVLALLRPGTLGLVGLLAVLGVGLGLFTSPNNAAIMGSVPPRQSGMASGILNMSRGLGTALGLAVTSLIFSVAGGDTGSHPGADHAFTVTALALAGVALAAGTVAALRPNGHLGDARMAAAE
jgi:MFS family permease